MATIEELMLGNLLEVFNERDPDRRRAAIGRTYVPEVTFSDPEETLVGHDALNAKAQGLLDQSPGLVFSPGGPVHVVNDLGYLAWNLGLEGGPAVVRGVDMALVKDGLITAVYTLLLTE